MAVQKTASVTPSKLTRIDGLSGTYEVTFEVTNDTAFTAANGTPIFVKVTFKSKGVAKEITQKSSVAATGTEIAIGTKLGLTGQFIADDIITDTDITEVVATISYFA